MSSKKFLKWRKRQKRGAIMKPAAFKRLAKEKGERLAGYVYWKTAHSKFRKRKH